MSAQLKPQTTEPAKTSLSKPAPAFISELVYVDPEIVSGPQGYNYKVQTQALFYYMVSFAKHTQINPSPWLDVDMTVAFPHQVETEAPEFNRALAKSLCEEHPVISTYQGVFGGFPHIKGIRFSVADVLSQLYVLGSIDEVEKAFAPDINKDQIKEAIAYAQDFLESALSS